MHLFASAHIMNVVNYGKEPIMEYIGIKDAAQKWGVSKRRVQFLCLQGRIPNAFRIGNVWAIPIDASKPGDKRKEKK